MNEFKLRAEDGSWPRFGDYAVVEQKRHFSSNEMYYHKVVATLESNSWVDVPVQSPATESLHDTSERIAIVICCGVDESKTYRVRVADLHKVEVASRPGEAMSGWIKCGDAKPADGQVVVVWRKWPNWDCFAAELDSWQADSSDEDGGAWYEAEKSCQHIETCADGPGQVTRPITTHWHPLPADPTE